VANGTPTYEEIERAANAIPDQRAIGAIANPIDQFCKIWPMMKKILQAARVFLPKPVRDKIDLAISVCDGICPG
jgi:hypothetical protein